MAVEHIGLRVSEVVGVCTGLHDLVPSEAHAQSSQLCTDLEINTRKTQSRFTRG